MLLSLLSATFLASFCHASPQPPSMVNCGMISARDLCLLAGSCGWCAYNNGTGNCFPGNANGISPPMNAPNAMVPCCDAWIHVTNGAVDSTSNFVKCQHFDVNSCVQKCQAPIAACTQISACNASLACAQACSTSTCRTQCLESLPEGSATRQLFVNLSSCLGPCNHDTRCKSLATTDLCNAAGSTYGTDSACTLLANCVTKVDPCAGQKNKIGCVANPICVWDAVHAMCIVGNDPCFAIASPTACMNNANCNWQPRCSSTLTCNEKCLSSFTNCSLYNDCLAAIECMHNMTGVNCASSLAGDSLQAFSKFY